MLLLILTLHTFWVLISRHILSFLLSFYYTKLSYHLNTFRYFLYFSLSVDATKDNGRFGRLLNHSKTSANVVTKLIAVNDNPYLCLIAARNIETGEELQYDYGERSKEAVASHPWLTL